ncbi:phage tail protein [Clostridium sp. ZS2-4]|nr:phage tail protein [Clostridium sp. ZS2-4]MCY6354502.1 phage tail protein [Clostridium sp. ZS2-4]
MIGEFPVFKAGENAIGFSENISKVEVGVNEVWI